MAIATQGEARLLSAVNPYSQPKSPKEELLNAVGSLDGITVLGTQVLLAVYIRPEVTAGGILRPTHIGAIKEDGFQGTVGLVIQLGSSAFTEDANHHWSGVTPGLHDWVLFSNPEALGVMLNGNRCRLIEDVNIRMVLPNPGVITDWIVSRPGYA